MTNFKILSTSLTAFLLMLNPGYCEDKKDDNFSKEQIDNIEKIVRDLMMREPQLIEKALNAGAESAQAEEDKKTAETLIKEKENLFNHTDDPILGNPKGSVSIVVFMDPYCGYCRKFESILKDVAAEQKELKIIYKAYPILGPESVKASEEQLAAHKIGRFKDFHEAIYESAVRSRKERFDLATQNRIDLEKLKENIPGLSHATGAVDVEKQLRENMKLGQRLGIEGTPAFVLGDQLVKGYVDKDTLLEMIKNLKK